MEIWPQIRFDFYSILFLLFCLSVLIQLCYLFYFPLRLIFFKKKEEVQKQPPVSIILCARNEEDNLFKNLPAILAQDYPEFEVIVVNDMSIDESNHILKAFQKQYPRLRYIDIEKNHHRKFGKKMPLTIGIKGAKYEHLVMIDADCYPSGNQWLKHVMSNYSDGKEIVLGVGPYERHKGFLNKLIRFDSTLIGSTYLSMALAKRPYMGVGRNLSYTKKRFFEVDGFKNHYHIQSGDDDLFIKDAATKQNVAISLNPESFVFSYPKKNWSDWVQQKQRHFTTAPRYKVINKLLLGILPASMFLMLLSFLILLFNYKWWWIVVAIFLIRIILFWLVYRAVFKKLGAKDLVWWIPLFEWIHFVVMPFIYYSTNRTEESKW